MILMWLGSFVVMLFAMSESQKQIAALFADMHKKILARGLGTSTLGLLTNATRLVLLEASPQQSLYSGMALLNLKMLDLRSSLLIMCFSVLGAWWVVILGMLYLSFNGFFLLGLSSLFWLNWTMTARMEKVFKWIFYAGLFLVGAEMVLKNTSVLQTLLGQSELAFMLADGRLESLVLIFLMSTATSFFVRCEFWSLALGLSLMVTNVLSLNGALALFAGERAGAAMLFWWRSRKMNQDNSAVASAFVITSILSSVLGFLVAGELRNLFYFGFESDLAAFQNKSLALMLLISVILLVQWMVHIVWGHFYYINKTKNII